jgi:hypothetical protein
MAIDLLLQLLDWANTIHMVSTATGLIEPGQKVDLQILSSARNMFVIDSVGGIQLPVGTGTLLPSLPVKLKVAWLVKDDEGNTLNPGTDYLITKAAPSVNSGQGQLISLIFMPPIVELGASEVPLTANISVEAEVTLEVLHSTPVANPTRVAVTIPSDVTRRLDPNHLKLPLELVPLEIPTFVALFRLSDYQPFARDMEPGFVLMIVPGSSPLRGLVEVTNDILQRLEDAVRPLRALAAMAIFLTRLTIARQALEAQPMIRIIAGDVDNLTDIHMRTETFLGVDIFNRDMRANDRVSSMIFMGPPNRMVGCYNDEEFAEGEGAFSVRVDETMITLIPVVRSVANEGVIEVLQEDDDDNRFEDSLTSVKFLENFVPPQQ